MIIYNCEQNSEAWIQARMGRVTGTRFAHLVSKETTDSWKDLITDIACEIITGRADEKFKNALMEEGLEMEDEAASSYEEITEKLTRQVGFITPDEDSQYHSWVGVSPDRLIVLKNGPIERGLEIKCPLMKTHFEYIEHDKLPAVYRHQVQGSLFVTGLPLWDFLSYSPGMKPFIVTVEPDLELFETYKLRLDMLIGLVKEKLDFYNKYHYLK